jgi:integrase
MMSSVDRYPRAEQARVLVAHAPERIRVLTIFLFCTGCRLGEALRLDWNEVDLNRRHCAFVNTKNGGHRGAILAEWLFVELANVPGEHKGLVFPIPRSSVYYPWAKMCRAAGVTDFTPHDCRHSWATWMRMGGKVDLRALMNFGGWDDPKSVIRYNHVHSDEMKPAIDAITFGKAPSKDRNSA